MIIQKYPYSALKRIQQDGSRKYTNGKGNPVPSVTTILSATGDKTALLEWRKRVGGVEAERQTKEAAGFGTMTHNALEKYLLGEDYEIKGNNLVHTIARRAFNLIRDRGLSYCDEIWGSEIGLIAEEIYAGTADCIGLYRGKPAIIDFKTAKRVKKREWITDYFLQGIFYAEAHNEMYGTDIKTVAIFMADREGEYRDYVIEGDEYEEYRLKAMLRLAEYYKMSID